MTIRDQKSGALLDVEDDGRKVSFELNAGWCQVDMCPCDHDVETRVTFDKAELLSLLGGGK